MQNEITKAFEGHNVRIDLENNQPLFHLGDVLKAVESKSETHKVVTSLDEDDRFTKPVMDSMGRKQEAWFINEMGLIELLTILRVPKTKDFRRWALREVIPSVLKTGSYSIEKPVTVEEQLAHAVLLSQKVIAEKDEKILELEPKATVHDKILSKDDTLGFLEMLRTLKDDFPGLKQKDLKILLLQKRLLRSTGVDASSLAIDKGYAREIATGTHNGKERTQSRWTPEGIAYIIKLLETK